MPVEVIFCSLLNEFIGLDDHRPVTIINDRKKVIYGDLKNTSLMLVLDIVLDISLLI